LIPIVAFAAVLFLLLARYVQLRIRLRASDGPFMACRTRLMALGRELARYALAHQGLLPADLERVLPVLKGAGAPDTCALVYRRVPELDRDNRLILAYDDAPRHPLLQFPRLVMGRNVLFAGGRVDLFAEEALHQLIVGDNVLRGRLGLPEIPFLEVSHGRSHGDPEADLPGLR
jgi:hypothetical protein